MAATVAASANSTAGAGTTHTLTLPSGVTGGDLLLAFSISNSGGATHTVSWSAGWTQIAQSSPAHAVVLAVAYRVATGSDSAPTATSTASANWAGRVLRVTGADTGTAPASGADALATSPNPPSRTAPWGEDDNLWIAVCGGQAAVTVSGAPSGYTGLVTHNKSLTGPTLAHATREATTAGEDPGAFSAPITVWRANVVVVRPAPPPASTGNFLPFLL